MSSSLKKIFSITFILNVILFSKIYTIDIIDIITIDNETSLREAIKSQNENGGTIYINTTIINIKTDLKLELKGDISGGIIGIKQPNNEYPRINFEIARNNGSFSSLNIYNSNKYLKYLIIENSPIHGVVVSGKNHTFEHIITRYNQYAGIFISEISDSNTFNYCYSYRNCDLKGNGVNGDGFFIKGATNTKFNHCFSWDNSNNGFSVSSHELKYSSLIYSHSACWNNGNANIFSGKYDYDNGYSLDKNMLTIQEIIKSNLNYEKNYKKKNFTIDNSKIDGKNANEWILKTKERTKGNGFQFGFAYSPDVTSIKRIAELSVAFDHKSKGFDNNFSKKYIGYFSNCVSFNNNINYQLPYTFEKWSNNWSWGSIQEDQKDMDMNLKSPNNPNESQKNFYSVKNQIIKAVNSNSFPEKINFDNSIMSLK